jgi:two-component system, cell cycle sensor histidine kinase and response regulator CckA
MMGTAQKHLGASELASVIDTLREGIQIIDLEWRYVYLNASAAAHGRKEASELLGRTMMECYPGIDGTALFTMLRRCMAERVEGSMRNEFAYEDGTRRNFELRVRACDVGIVVMSVDITDEQRMEAQFRHAQKMEAVGRLAGSVAHDFNNVLSVILSLTSIILTDLKAIDPLRIDIETIKKAGERGADLTRQLLAFSRQQVIAPRTVDMNEIVLEAERMLKRLLREDVELVTHCQRQLSKVMVDPGQIDQVILNLAINARDAMPDGGKLTIETRDVVLDDSYANGHFGSTPGPHVMLAVSDTGVGMSKETQARIFEPFFTTKGIGKGTGLGLSTVFGIVQQCRGNIWVYSEPGGGTTFKVYFPTHKGPDTMIPEPTAPVTLQGTETILLVEDQDDVRQVAQQILRRYGYHVIEARNAGEAWLTSERHPRTIQLLLTDVVMPQMSGRELAERLTRARPEMKVLYMSGYTDNTIVHHGILDSGIAYLQKPILPEMLARRVREVLDGPGPLT